MKRPLDRDRGVVRDASLIVIASEDTHAVQDYFARFKTYRTQIKVLPTEDCRSAPQHVMERLTEFERDVPIIEGDTLWICIDRDRWDKNSLGEVVRESMKRGYHIALSSPCFELWVLLHFQDCAPAPAQNCDQVSQSLRSMLGGYTKKCCKSIPITREMVDQAVARARRLDTDEFALVPEANATRVYKIIDALISRDSLEFIPEYVFTNPPPEILTDY